MIANQTETTDAAVHLDLVPIAQLVVGLLMTAAVASALMAYFSWWFAIPISMVLSWLASRLAVNVFGPASSIGWGLRLASLLMLVAVLATTVGLSYSALYSILFAKTSAIEDYERQRTSTERVLSTAVAHATTVETAVSAWATYSEEMAANEAKSGGTCPSKAASKGIRGPIAMFRTNEAAIAKDLGQAVSAGVKAITTQTAQTVGKRATSFEEARRQMTIMNAALQAADALAHQSLASTVQATLENQRIASIRWPNGEEFECGDMARNTLIERARRALSELKAMPAFPALSVAINLSDSQAITGRGLLRSYNLLLHALSFGLAGQFGDDPLMVEALKRGIINQETVGFLLACLIEIAVLATALLQARRPHRPLPVNPAAWIQRLERGSVSGTTTVGASNTLYGSMLRLAANLVLVHEDCGTPTRQPQAVEFQYRSYPEREMQLAANHLAPYVVPAFGGEEYIFLPASAPVKTIAVAQMLAAHGAALLLSTQSAWRQVASHPNVSRRLQALVPGANTTSWSVFKLTPDFAQALRLKMLAA